MRGFSNFEFRKNLIKCSLLNAIESGNIITDGKPPKYHQRPENRRAKSEMSHANMTHTNRAEPSQNHIGLTRMNIHRRRINHLQGQ